MDTASLTEVRSTTSDPVAIIREDRKSDHGRDKVVDASALLAPVDLNPNQVGAVLFAHAATH